MARIIIRARGLRMAGLALFLYLLPLHRLRMPLYGMRDGTPTQGIAGYESCCLSRCSLYLLHVRPCVAAMYARCLPGLLAVIYRKHSFAVDTTQYPAWGMSVYHLCACSACVRGVFDAWYEHLEPYYRMFFPSWA